MQHPVVDYEYCMTQYYSMVPEPLNMILDSTLVLAVLTLRGLCVRTHRDIRGSLDTWLCLYFT